jgi:hypothetical protein
MVRLSGLPGLQFLGHYVTEYQNRRTVVKQTVSRYQSYVQTVRGTAEDVKKASSDSKKEEEDDPVEEDVENYYEEDDDESYLQ